MRRVLAILPLLAWQPAAGMPGVLDHVGVSSIELSEMTTDRVRFRVHLAGIAGRDLALRTLSVDDVWLNGIPVFVPSPAGPVRISKGKRFDDIGPLHATVFFRDLESLDPLRRMVSDEKATVRATIRLQPELNLLQRVALRTSNAWASASLERTVAVTFPGGILGRKTLLLGMVAAEPVWVLGRAGVEWRQARDGFLQQVRTQYASRVLAIESRYEIRGKDGRSTILHWRGLGFHANKGRVLVPAEAVEPWMFEGPLADAISSNNAHVVEGSLDILVRGYSLHAGDVKILAVARDRVKAISIDRRKIYPMRERNSEANFAWLEIPALAASEPDMPAMEEASVKDAVASSVAIFRLRSQAEIEVSLLAIAVENGRIRLVEPVDSRAFGSPVIGPAGLLGMLQDQTSVTSMRRLAPVLQMPTEQETGGKSEDSSTVLQKE